MLVKLWAVQTHSNYLEVTSKMTQHNYQIWQEVEDLVNAEIADNERLEDGGDFSKK